MKGRSRIRNSVYDDLSMACAQIFMIPRRIHFNKSFDKHFLPPCITHSLVKIIYFFRNITSIIIGVDCSSVHDSTYEVMGELLKERNSRLSVQENIDKRIFEWLFYVNKKSDGKEEVLSHIETLAGIEKIFMDEMWAKEKYEVEDNTIDDEYQKIEINKEKRRRWIQFIKSQKSFTPELIESLLGYYEDFCILNDLKFEKRLQMEKEIESLLNDYKKKHPILSRIEWRFDQYEREVRIKIGKKHQEEIIPTELKNLLQTSNKSSSIVFNDYLDFNKTLDIELKNRLKKLGKKTYCHHDITLYRKIFPPWKVLKTKEARGKFSYSLERVKGYTHIKNHFAWRFTLVIKRFWIWTNNTVFYLYAAAIVGPLGIMKLFRISSFYTDKTIDSSTGEVKEFFKIK
jgi:hypothetical protein